MRQCPCDAASAGRLTQASPLVSGPPLSAGTQLGAARHLPPWTATHCISRSACVSRRRLRLRLWRPITASSAPVSGTTPLQYSRAVQLLRPAGGTAAAAGRRAPRLFGASVVPQPRSLSARLAVHTAAAVLRRPRLGAIVPRSSLAAGRAETARTGADIFAARHPSLRRLLSRPAMIAGAA
jgi:hypothetical protein